MATALYFQNHCRLAGEGRLWGAVATSLPMLERLTSLTFVATGEPPGLEIGVDRSLLVGLRDDQEQILPPDKTFGLGQNNLRFQESGDLVRVVPGLLTFGRVEIGGDFARVSFSWEA